MRVIAWLIFVLSLLASLYCGHAFLFWAWLTATPLTPTRLAQAQYNANVWLSLTAASVLAAVASFVWVIRLGRRPASRGFEVMPGK